MKHLQIFVMATILIIIYFQTGCSRENKSNEKNSNKIEIVQTVTVQETVLTANEVLQIIYLGGGITINSNNYTEEELTQITYMAGRNSKSASPPILVITNSFKNLTSDQIKKFSYLGKGCVRFQ